MGVVDEAFPANDGAGFFKINAHNNQQVAREAGGDGLQLLRVFESGRRIMNGTGADDGQQTVVLTPQDIANCVPRRVDQRRAGLGQRQILFEDGGRDEGARSLDAKIGSQRAHEKM